MTKRVISGELLDRLSQISNTDKASFLGKVYSMLPQALVNYLTLTKSQNIQFEQLITPLRQQGWDDGTIEQARAWYSNSQPAVSQTPTLTPSRPHEYATTIDATPVAFANNSSSPNASGHGKKIAISILVLFLLSAVVATGLGLIAYEKINLPDRQLQQIITENILSLPFLPKTPEYVIRKSVVEQAKVERFNLDASIAITSSEFSQITQSGKFDLAIKGPVDFTNPDSPSLSLNIALSKDFEGDLMLKNKKAYFRINQLPSTLSTYMAMYGVNQNYIDQFLKKWFYYEYKNLETEARKNLNNSSYNKSLTQRTVNAFLDAITDEKYGSTLTMEEAMIDGFESRTIHLVASNRTVDEIQKSFSTAVLNETDTPKANDHKISDSIKNLTADYWIDKKGYYVRKIAISFVIVPPQANARLMPSTLGANTYEAQQFPAIPKEIPVSIVLHMTKFNEPITITPPTDAVSIEEFIKTMYAQMYGSQNSAPGIYPTDQLAQANNTSRRSDTNAILNAINQYMADNQGKVPSGITTQTKNIAKNGADICTDLVPTYIAALPIDVAISGGHGIPVESSLCATNYDTGYTVIQDATTNRLTVAAPLAENGQVISVTR